MRNISNSEVSTFLQCEYRHYLAHIQNLEPKSHSLSLSRGIIGHSILASYYKHFQLVGDHHLAVGHAYSYGQSFYGQPGVDSEMLLKLFGLLAQYWDYHAEDINDWEILSVEEKYTLPLVEDFTYVMRSDLVIRVLRGQFAGDIVVVDHKFVYDFWQVSQHLINPQLPKYKVAIKNSTGLEVRRGLVNQLRHRDRKLPYTNEERYKRTFVSTTPHKDRMIMQDQIMASERIRERYQMPIAEAKRKALRVLNTMVCKNCPFIYPCTSDLDGQDITLMLETEFQPNTYNSGYSEDEE